MQIEQKWDQFFGLMKLINGLCSFNAASKNWTEGTNVRIQEFDEAHERRSAQFLFCIFLYIVVML